MLDSRYDTFITLCRIMNFTKTGEALHITQPAVSQHIKYLEEYYGCKLFVYEGKTLSLTSKGEKLKNFVITLNSDSKRIKKMMSEPSEYGLPMNFGVTLSIGEAIISPVVEKIALEFPNVNVNMSVDNTQILLEKLKSGQIDFALVEGMFDKSMYGFEEFSKEKFIAVAGINSDIPDRKLRIDELFSERLIIREQGSGSRLIFEQWLRQNNYTIKSFNNIFQIADVNVIRKLVLSGTGVSFLYSILVKNELEKETIRKLDIENFNIVHEFNFVYLKESVHKQEYKKIFKFFKEAI